MHWILYKASDVCVKCGRDGSSHTLDLLPAKLTADGVLLPERFKVECRKCNHRWHRLPLDANVEQVNRDEALHILTSGPNKSAFVCQ